MYPREVEEVLYEHPAMAEAAVVGVPDDLHGEEIVAVIGTRAEHAPADDAAREALPTGIVDFPGGRMAASGYPRRVVLADALPKGPTGEILKREIRI